MLRHKKAPAGARAKKEGDPLLFDSRRDVVGDYAVTWNNNVGAVPSGVLVGMALAAEPSAGVTMGTNDIVCLELDDGTFQYTTLASGGWSDFSIADALEDDVAAGNKVWQFGVHTDDGHIRFNLTASVQTSKAVEGGIFYAKSKNRPMIVYHVNDAVAAGSIDYVSIDYINV